MMMIASKGWLKLIYELMKKKMIEEKYLHADETTVQVLKEEDRINTTNHICGCMEHIRIQKHLYKYLNIVQQEVERMQINS